jgi:hypothetical protein
MSAAHKIARERLARALAIRDHVVPLIYGRGVLTGETDNVRILTWRAAFCGFLLRVPLNLPPVDDERPMRAPRPSGLPSELHYGLDVTRNRVRLLTVQWAENGRAELLFFKPGHWEADVLGIPGAWPVRRAA